MKAFEVLIWFLITATLIYIEQDWLVLLSVVYFLVRIVKSNK